jgi:hypothetical protein
MVASNDLTGWAQVGFGRFGSNDPFPGQPGGFSKFSQWKRGPSADPHTTVTGNGPNGQLEYRTEYVFSTGRIQMWAGSTLVDETGSGFDPVIDWESPWQPQFFGETIHAQSDMPGVQSNHVEFTHMKRLADRNGNWLNMTNPAKGIIGSAPSRYHRQWVNQPTAGDIWTDPL